MTGVCPQHDVLFDLLTPGEHLAFYAKIRVRQIRILLDFRQKYQNVVYFNRESEKTW